jgi:hypothetical protein
VLLSTHRADVHYEGDSDSEQGVRAQNVRCRIASPAGNNAARADFLLFALAFPDGFQ